jgi:hypothetical protein
MTGKFIQLSHLALFKQLLSNLFLFKNEVSYTTLSEIKWDMTTGELYYEIET